MMNRRDRVLAAIRHEQPDFVPYNFHGSAGVYAALRHHYGFSDNQTLVEFIGNHVVKVGSDFNVNPWEQGVQVQSLPSGGPLVTAEDQAGALHTDEFGCVWNRSGSRAL